MWHSFISSVPPQSTKNLIIFKRNILTVSLTLFLSALGRISPLTAPGNVCSKKSIPSAGWIRRYSLNSIPNVCSEKSILLRLVYFFSKQTLAIELSKYHFIHPQFLTTYLPSWLTWLTLGKKFLYCYKRKFVAVLLTFPVPPI